MAVNVTHPMFIQPPNENNKIWRYMSFTKLVSLLESSCLFFSRADKLGDPFEGSWPKINVSARIEVLDGIPEGQRASYVEAMKNLSLITKQWPKHIAVNCWHMNEHESAAMWKLYMQGNEGIAIQSTYKKLKDSLIDEEQIYLGLVKYIDYQTEGIYASNMFSPFMHKRKSYEHEREVRALIMKMPTTGDKTDYSKESISNGLKIRVDMGILIEQIYVAPYCPDWFEDLVRSIVVKYGFSFKIVHSGLDDPPLF